jgi:SapC
LHVAERLFDDAGGPTVTAQSAMGFCHAYHADYTSTVAFSQALVAAKALEPYHADFRLPDGSLHQVNGFSAVNEKASGRFPPRL